MYGEKYTFFRYVKVVKYSGDVVLKIQGYSRTRVRRTVITGNNDLECPVSISISISISIACLG